MKLTKEERLKEVLEHLNYIIENEELLEEDEFDLANVITILDIIEINWESGEDEDED